MKLPLKPYLTLACLVSLMSCGGESIQSSIDNPEIQSGLSRIENTPNEQDRYSLLTGQLSSESYAIVDSMEEIVREDERMSVKFVLYEPVFVNVQVSISRNELAEVWTLMEEQFNSPAVSGPSPKITALGYAPLYDDFFSEWQLLQPGRYSTEVDNTNSGQYSPPWNGVDDWFTARVTILTAPQFAGAARALQNDATIDKQPCCGRLIETQITKIHEEEGF